MEIDDRERCLCLPALIERARIFDLTGEVALLGRSLDVGCGLDHGDVEVLAVAAVAAVHLGEPYSGGVLDGAARLAPALVHRRAHPRRRARSFLSAACSVRATSRRRRRGVVVARAWPDSSF